ncbi:MAG: tripartite tricarboxylate transporter permease [Candidatus Rokubacteria bacterium]|nr:tripartite tricarboxylate transporter permease [Candidatus Rokubacteria bacterium]
MDVLPSILFGFQVALQPANLAFCFAGVLVGTLVGVLPGLGPSAAISLLLPATYHVAPVSAVIMLAGIYYGAMYGGSTTSILVNIPGEAASVVTCLDGYQMARQGRAGVALGLAAFGSFIAGTAGVLGLMLIAPPLAELALRFGPPEYFALMILGLVTLTFLASGPMWKALLMAALGVFLGSIGLDPLQGMARFTFDLVELSDGVGLVPVAMGLFGVAEVLSNLEQPLGRSVFETEVRSLLPRLRDWAESAWPIARGTVIGFFLGVLPGGGAAIASFVSYAVEKRVSRHPERFGRGAVAGVAGPESANNAATAGAFIPLLTLGLPANAVMAILLGALMVHGMQPGPLLVREHPEVFWGVVASMYLGNLMLLVLNLPLIGLWVKILKVPYPILFPLILLFCLIGAYSLSGSTTEVVIMVVFGVLGYGLRKLEYEPAPLILALVLGPMMETALRRSLLLSAGSPLIFVTRPIAAVLVLAALVLLLVPLVPRLARRRAAVLRDSGA